MNACIDIGNTYIKTGFFSGDKLTGVDSVSSLSMQNIYKALASKEFSSAILSSVQDVPGHIVNYIKSKAHKFIELNSKTPLPVINKYKSKDTLGNDRIAQAAGGRHIFPNENILVISAGTCLVYDFIDKKGNYPGGAISPGMAMRFKALNQFTAKLPLIEPVEDIPLTGTDTTGSILSGVVNGIVFEVQKAIEEYTNKYGSLQCILSGGDSLYFADKLKATVTLEPHLTLIGLNKILQFNAKAHN